MLICAGGLGLSSLLGSTAGLIVRKIPHQWNDIFLGFCAGMMLTASLVCLIVPAVDMAGAGGWWQPLIGVALGVRLIALLDRLTPHLHHLSGLDGNLCEEEHHPVDNKSINRVLLFVIAIAIHTIPEGRAVSVPIYYATGSKVKALRYSFLTGLAEPIGAAVGALILLPFWNPVIGALLLAFVAGIMVYISFDELLPGAEQYGHHHMSIIGVVAGMAIMAGGLLLF